ncbi:hypothetical protein [Rheinheimera sp. MMS21-TC3]|uniref:hypothetical protein n=1 Tax=Rheinheimera sp. MMS21-TC3 TaxID=3072790 RepID=UPI0028C4A52E|nr:hypothetical protein [Rheinheimera sp. MMS21-TC3]WNO61670.1 hypothetical protein RDV63_12140 [Rheinheimera sp. MMS21-TC3]
MTLPLRHQFVLTTANDPLVFPNHFRQWSLVGFRLATEPSLPVVSLLSGQGEVLGYIVGWAMLQDKLLTQAITLPVACASDLAKANSPLETWLYQLAGRWLAFIVTEDTQRVYMDPLASQSLVYAPASKRLAATPGLMEAKLAPLFSAEQLINDDCWYPAGCTAYKGVQRLLANHYLDLQSFAAKRHWPLEDTALPVCLNWQQRLPTIATLMQQQFTACSEAMPVRIGLTAGVDSRVMLACSQGVQNKVDFWTRADRSFASYQDIKTATQLAKKFNLQHQVFQFQPKFALSEDEITQFLSCTGYAIGGSPLKSSKLIDSVGLCFAFSGVGGAIAKGYYLDKVAENTKQPELTLTPETLLSLCGLPYKEPLIAALAHYIKCLPNLPIEQLLALFYQENRVSAYSAINRYGFQSGIVFISPFSHRDIIELMLCIPIAEQRKGAFHQQLIHLAWPELAAVPANSALDFIDRCILFYHRAIRRLKRAFAA